MAGITGGSRPHDLDLAGRRSSAWRRTGPANAPLDAPADAAARLGAVLRAAGYTAEGLGALLGDDLTALGDRAVPVVVRRTGDGSALATLARLFVAGVTVPRDRAVRAIGGEDVVEWAAHGLLDIDADAVRARVQLACHGDLVLATDFGPVRAGVGTAPDHVMGLSPSTLTLARLTVRDRVEDALDVGTGCGVQALLCAEHSVRVLATDVGPRAVAMARFNAALNGATAVTVAQGDLLEPAARRRFGLIVSNPPFVVDPRPRHLYAAGDPADGGVCRRLARDAPALLTAGGVCQFLANWAVCSGQEWQDVLAPWFEGGGCEVWVIRRERQAADEYAAQWVETDTGTPEELTSRFDEWMRDYEARGIEAVDYGLVTMRRRADGEPGRLRLEDLPDRWGDADGSRIAATMAAHDWLERTGDDALLDTRLRLSDDARLARDLVAVRGEWVEVAARIHAAGGLHEPGSIDPHGERLVARCDGATPLRVLVTDMAGAVGAAMSEVAPAALAAVRRLVERGVLVRADPDAPG